jgi:uridine kinase
VEVPHYDISVDRCTGYERLALNGAPRFVAEGIFAAEIVAACRDRGVLAAAYALRRPRGVTFVRRLVRDLREHRKPPATLLRRGIRLYRAESRILSRQVALGCRPVSAATVRRAVTRTGSGRAAEPAALS